MPRRCCEPGELRRHVLSINGQKVSCQLAATAIAAWLRIAVRGFALVENGQLRLSLGARMRGLQQHGLQVSIALFGDGHALELSAEVFLSAAQAAVDDLLDEWNRSTSPTSSTQVSAVT